MRSPEHAFASLQWNVCLRKVGKVINTKPSAWDENRTPGVQHMKQRQSLPRHRPACTTAFHNLSWIITTAHGIEHAVTVRSYSKHWGPLAHSVQGVSKKGTYSSTIWWVEILAVVFIFAFDTLLRPFPGLKMGAIMIPNKCYRAHNTAQSPPCALPFKILGPDSRFHARPIKPFVPG